MYLLCENVLIIDRDLTAGLLPAGAERNRPLCIPLLYLTALYEHTRVGPRDPLSSERAPTSGCAVWAKYRMPLPALNSPCAVSVRREHYLA